MDKRDAFVRGLALIFEERPELKPSRVSVDAGLDNSTIRKMLAGDSGSPKIETAEKISHQLGLPLATIISIGENPDGRLIFQLAQRIANLPAAERERIDHYIDVRMPQTIPEEEPAHEHREVDYG